MLSASLYEDLDNVGSFTLHLLCLLFSASQALATGAKTPPPEQKTLTRLSIPLVMKARDIDPIINYPLSQMRVFKSSPNKEAIPIPFQIDETNRYGDYIFNTSRPHDRGNGIFDRIDELSVMSGDFGSAIPPTKWGEDKPYLVYEVVTNAPAPNNTFYVALFAGKKQPYNTKKYVRFNPDTATIDTDIYRMALNKRNYLTIEDVVFKFKNKEITLIDWSSFYLKLDFKYFLNFEEDHNSINSKMAAYKSGSIRTILRIDFILQLLRLKINPGFFTEISFFANSLHLPAIIYSPFNHRKVLNNGSRMSYGFALTENPSKLDLQTNMPRYDGAMHKHKNSQLNYWLGVYAPQYTILIDINSSYRLRKNKFSPFFHVQNLPASKLSRNDRKDPNKQINTAVFFDLTRLTKGEQRFSFRSYFFNQKQSLPALSFSHNKVFVVDVRIVE